MLSAQLQDQFQNALAELHRGDPPAGREASIRFAVEFAGLLSRIVPEDSPADAVASMGASLEARTPLEAEEIALLIELAMLPEYRSPIDFEGLRTFGARFGNAAEQAVRAAMVAEIDLAGFTERYGSGEGLLLLDALFGICAVDGVISHSEIDRLEDAAGQLGIDPMLVSALFRKHDNRHATGDFTYDLTEDQYVIGRSPGSDIRLPDPLVGSQHCRMVREQDGWRVVDIGSGRPTLLDGAAIASSPFRYPSVLKVGSYSLELTSDEQQLRAFGSSSFSALSVRHLSRKIGDISLLDDISFTVFSGEVVAVVGPSGAGKTTLLNAIAGIAPADEGSVILDGRNFHEMLSEDRSLIGNVPQEDVVHADLTVEEALRYAARLRFPANTSDQTLQEEVDRVLIELDIDRIRGNRIGDEVRRGISGGQRKRVNLGQELLTQSTRVLFLDEPTSGLDPQTGQDIVGLIRQLADGGRIIFFVTHDITPAVLEQVDHLMVLAPGGRLAWFGPPDDAPPFFGVRTADDIFTKLSEEPAEVWGDRYREGPAGRTFVRTREHLLGLDGVETSKMGVRPVRGGFWSQFRTLTSRYTRVKLRDRSGTAVLLMQAPILGLAMWVVFPAADTNSLFMLALSTLWFGASASVRELISERAIWRRESRVGLRSSAYLASKVTILGILVGLQCGVLAVMNHVLLEMGGLGFSLLGLASVSILTGWVGMALGLCISALFASSEGAVGTLPLLLIPQITFGGLIVKVKEMGLVAKAISSLMIVRYSFDGLIKTGERLTVPARRGMDRDLEGRDIAGSLWELGFRGSTNPDDLGLTLPMLVLILLAFGGVFLGISWFFTARSRDGN